MATALFITEEHLKSYTAIDENVDPSILYPYVLQAQDTWIQTTLGTKLYNKMKDLVVDNVMNGTPIPTDYKTLLDDYIAPTVTHFAFFAALPAIKFRAYNKGLLSGTSENGSPASLDELQFFRNNIFDTAKFYNERLREYLCQYSSLYPEYMEYTTKDGMPPKKTTAYYTGLVIPTRRRAGFNDCCGDGEYNYPLN